MLAQEKGTCSGSDLYFHTASEYARRLLYCMEACGYYYTNYDYEISRENYHNFLIFYICGGRLSVTSGGKTMVASAGQVGFLNCYEPHEYHTIGNTEFIWLHLNGANTAAFYEHIAKLHDGFVFDSPCADEIKKRIYEIIFAYRNQQLPNENRLSCKLYAILTALADGTPNDAADKSAGSDAVTRAMRFIESNFMQPISLPELSQYVNMSQYHFSRQFKKNCGYAPHEYIILTRLNHAKHLLKTTDLPVKIIAQNVGYQNVSTFTNAFTNRVGISPSTFREYPI